MSKGKMSALHHRNVVSVPTLQKQAGWHVGRVIWIVLECNLGEEDTSRALLGLQCDAGTVQQRQ